MIINKKCKHGWWQQNINGYCTHNPLPTNEVWWSFGISVWPLIYFEKSAKISNNSNFIFLLLSKDVKLYIQQTRKY